LKDQRAWGERRYHEPDHQAYQDDVTAAP